MALLVLVGRFTGQTRWVSLVPGGAPMAFFTAACFLVAGAALMVLGAGRLAWGRWLGLALMLTGGGTLLVYLVAGLWRLPWLAFTPNQLAQGVRFDGQMSPNAAVAFLILGLACVLMSGPRLWTRTLALLGALLVALGFLALSSYLVGLRYASAWWRYSGMAVPTAFAVMLMGGLVIVWVMRRALPEDRTTAHSVPLFAAAGCLIAVVGGITFLSHQQLLATSRLVVNMHEVRGAIDHLVAEVARMESSARGYALTGVPAFRTRVGDHQREMEGDFQQLTVLTQDVASLAAEIPRLRVLAGLKVEAANAMIHVREEHGQAAAQRLLMEQPQENGSALVNLADEIRGEATRLLRQRDAEWATTERASRLVQGLAGGMAFVLVIVAFSLEYRATRARKRVEQELRDLNEQLEQRVRERTAALDATMRTLEQTEAHYRRVTESLPQLVWTCASDGRCDWLGPQWVAYTGLPAGPQLGYGWLEQVHPEDREPVQRAWSAAASSGQVFDAEFRIRRHDGEYRWFKTRALPLRGPDGGIARWFGANTDIHEQKEVAALLERLVRERTSELAVALRFQRAMLDGTVLSVIATDEAGRVTEFNSGAEHMLGYRRDEIVGRTTPLLIHLPEELEARARELSRELGRAIPAGFEAFVARTRLGHVDEREWTYVRKDGGRLPVWLSVTALRNEEGQITGFLGIAQDLTERKAAEEARLESEERFHSAFENATIGMALVGQDGRWLKVNTALCEFLGYDEQGLMQRTFQDITHPDDLEIDLAHVHELLAGQRRSYQMEKRYLHQSGRVVWARLAVSLVRDAAGRPRHFVSQIEDITDRKLLQEKLEQARDAALEASRMKSEFLANMSHEIRTPMNGIIGMTGLLLDTSLNTEQREMAQVVQSSANHLLTIINDILDFSRVEAGKLRIEPTEFDLKQLVEETLALLAPPAHAKQLELLCVCEEGLPSALRGDAVRIRQVLTNLVGNAVKFTDRGEVKVSVSRRQESQDHLRFRIDVSDTGVGIPAEQQGRLFEAFVQADTTTTRRYGGTGLGLAISRQLVGLMGGTIGVSSQPNQGSTFWFELELPKLARVPAPPLPHMPAGMTALVVDDNETNRRILCQQLLRLDVVAEAVDGAAAALSLLRARARSGRPFAFALLDLRMPGTDGVELAEQIRRDPAIAITPLFVLSSAATGIEPETVQRLGLEAVLTKPVREEHLQRVLLEFAGRGTMEGRAAARPAAASAPTPSPLRVLVAEDNEPNQLVARGLLERMGHTVVVAPDGQSALEQLRQGPFDVVLMDCQMPVMDGYNATAQIRKGAVPGVNSRIPIIALTAFALPSDRLKCISAGMDDYVAKPLRAADIVSAFQRCGLKSAPVAAPPAPSGQPDADVLDVEQLRHLHELPGRQQASLLRELVGILLNEAPVLLTRLTECEEQRLAPDLALLAHRLAGSAANLGGRSLRAAALALEKAAQKQDWEAVVERRRDLDREWERFSYALKRFCA